MLQIRPRNHFWYRIGNGHSVSAWFDNWCEKSPISNSLSARVISNASFLLSASVSDHIRDNMWSWPLEWSNILPPIEVPALQPDQPDSLFWKDKSGSLQPFSVSQFGLNNAFQSMHFIYDSHSHYVPCLVESKEDKSIWKDRNRRSTDFSVENCWEAIRHRSMAVPWFHVVWFPYCIPRHAFHLWLGVRRKLKTQDLMKSWDISLKRSCGFKGIQQIHVDWESIISAIIPQSKKRTIDIIVIKLLLVATSYFIW
uniref:uncharacterized protein LOC122583273 n=1 Tax=Erigeron canadensis TaxID=72917 RepID=UPI001CB99D79|nr:uncharacterized protein LOC122583273 [Erigeron canadensis]